MNGPVLRAGSLVCGSEHEARVLVEGPGFGVGPVLEAARKPGRSERGHTGPGVTYSLVFVTMARAVGRQISERWQ